MQCPYCHKEIQIPTHAFNNATTYYQPVVSITECCGHGVRLEPVRTVRVQPYQGEKTEDDWGNAIIK